jgi:aconitate hydratase
MQYLEGLNFHLVGFGCTTCIGNSGPIPEAVAEVVQKDNLVVSAVLSGNRNFEGRINPLVKANYLASPPLVIAYALAGTVDLDIANDPLGTGSDGKPVYLRDIWPTNAEVQETVRTAVHREMFEDEYARAFDGDSNWQGMRIPTGGIYQWDHASTHQAAVLR